MGLVEAAVEVPLIGVWLEYLVGREAGLGLANECVEGREVELGSVEGLTLRLSSGFMSFEEVDKEVEYRR